MIIDQPPRDADLPADAQRTATIMARVRQVPAYGPAVAERHPATARQAERPSVRRWWPVLALLLVLSATLLSDALADAFSGAPEVVASEPGGWAPLLGDALLAALAVGGIAVVLSRRSTP